MIVELNNDNFKEQTRNGLKLIEFYTDWCGYCKKQVNELVSMDKIWIGQINAEQNANISKKFNIRAYPTFIIMKNGEEVERLSGFKPKENLMERIMYHL